MQRVLVTGAGGYIGTTLVPLLLERGYAVRAVDRFFFGEDLLPHRDHLEKLREDSRRLTPAHFAGVDHVIDLVAISNDPSGERFQDATRAINHRSRARTARLAKAAGVQRYLLPSSCSIYGFQEPGVVCREGDAVNPLTTYARSNLAAERDVLPLADDRFTVVVLRQATVFGYSPRMRFDLAINGMSYGAWATGRLPLLRDGTQYRPMVHVRDAAAAQLFMLEHPDVPAINGRIFNVGSAGNNYRLADLAEIVRTRVERSTGRGVSIEWYGDPDHRSYQVCYDRIEALGWKAGLGAEEGVADLCSRLASGRLAYSARTITLDWYRNLTEWFEALRSGGTAPDRPDNAADWVERTQLHGGILDVADADGDSEVR